jgi:hypothetical protein
MKISTKIVKKFQEGGPMPAEPAMGGAPAGGAPAPEGGMPAEGGAPAEDPIMQIAELAMQALQSQDCQAAMAACEGFVGLLQGSPDQGMGGAGAPPEGAPVFKKGGKLAKRMKKANC